MLAFAVLAAMAYVHPEQLVDTAWLQAHAADANVRVVDMRREGYGDAHAPGAVALLPDAIRDAASPPTFLPTADAFERMMARLGISDATRVVAYDDRGGIYAARLWWILSYFGHTNAAILDGGWPAWAAEHRPFERAEPAIAEGVFHAHPQPALVATAADVVAAIGKAGTKIVDARTAAEIEGKDLRGIRRGGFVPSSVPVYWEDLLEPGTRMFKPADALRQIFESRGILPDERVIAYCQVGMRASLDIFALHLIGYDHLRNYYGAWEEWGNRDDLPLGKK